MTNSPQRQHTHDYLVRRAQAANAKASQMMTDGTRDYAELRRLVEEYITNQYAADAITGQTDTEFGGL